MNWMALTEEQQLQEIDTLSENEAVVIFKHSTRCSISSMAKNRLERAEAPAGTPFYYLDLIKYRSLSNAIADRYKVTHESPQILIIKNGECVFDESHNGIDMAEIAEQVSR